MRMKIFREISVVVSVHFYVFPKSAGLGVLTTKSVARYKVKNKGTIHLPEARKC